MLVEQALELGLRAYPLETKYIEVENRTRLKCAYGCRGYGKRLSCPLMSWMLMILDRSLKSTIKRSCLLRSMIFPMSPIFSRHGRICARNLFIRCYNWNILPSDKVLPMLTCCDQVHAMSVMYVVKNAENRSLAVFLLRQSGY